MKGYPVYKCKRCGEILILRDFQALSPEELSCVDSFITHTCDVSDGKLIGIMELVGYDEVEE